VIEAILQPLAVALILLLNPNHVLHTPDADNDDTGLPADERGRWRRKMGEEFEASFLTASFLCNSFDNGQRNRRRTSHSSHRVGSSLGMVASTRPNVSKKPVTPLPLPLILVPS